MSVRSQHKRNNRAARFRIKALKEIENPSEHLEQVAVVQWAQANSGTWPALAGLYAIPNGGDRNVIVGQKMKAEGVRKGFPDLGMPWPLEPYHGLYIEMKRRKGGKLSIEQSQWIDWLRDAGYFVAVCRGADAAIDLLERWVSGGPIDDEINRVD